MPWGRGWHWTPIEVGVWWTPWRVDMKRRPSSRGPTGGGKRSVVTMVEWYGTWSLHVRHRARTTLRGWWDGTRTKSWSVLRWWMGWGTILTWGASTSGRWTYTPMWGWNPTRHRSREHHGIAAPTIKHRWARTLGVIVQGACSHGPRHWTGLSLLVVGHCGVIRTPRMQQSTVILVRVFVLVVVGPVPLLHPPVPRRIVRIL